MAAFGGGEGLTHCEFQKPYMFVSGMVASLGLVVSMAPIGVKNFGMFCAIAIGVFVFFVGVVIGMKIGSNLSKGER